MEDLFGAIGWGGGGSTDSYFGKMHIEIFKCVIISTNCCNNSWFQFNALQFGQALKLNTLYSFY